MEKCSNFNIVSNIYLLFDAESLSNNLKVNPFKLSAKFEAEAILDILFFWLNSLKFLSLKYLIIL